jgi:hypothetical protein
MSSTVTLRRARLVVRADIDVASTIADLVATSRQTDPPAPIVDGVVLEAHHVDRLTDLRTVLRDAGVPVWVDPLTIFWQVPTEPAFAWNDLTFGFAPVTDITTLDTATLRELVRHVVEFQLRAGASAVFSPYLYAEDPNDPAFGATCEMLRLAGEHMRDTGLDRHHRLMAVICGNVTKLGAESPRETIVSRFARAMNDAGVSSVATMIGPVGQGNETAVKLQRFISIHTDLKRLQGVREVVALRQGVYGEALLATGIDAYETGITTKERCDIRDTQSRRKPRTTYGERKGSFRGIYVDGLNRSIPREKAKILLANDRVRGLMACMDVSCCPNGHKSMISNAFGHAIRARSTGVSTLADIPNLQWRLNHVERAARKAAREAATLNAILAKYDSNSKKPYKIPVRGYESLAEVCAHMRESSTHHADAA